MTFLQPAWTWIADHPLPVALLVLIALMPAVYARALRAGWLNPPSQMRTLGWFAAPLVPVGLALVGVVLGALWKTTGLLFADTPGEELRWHVLGFVGLMTALAALLGTPLALIRLAYTERQTAYQQRQTDRADTAHVIEQINTAVETLGAERSLRRSERRVTFVLDGVEQEIFTPDLTGWRDALPEGAQTPAAHEIVSRESVEPDIARRIGALYALERVARENLDYHIQIMEILIAYLRVNAPASSAFPIPEDFATSPMEYSLNMQMRSFILEKLQPRDDVQIAFTVIGRRKQSQIDREASEGFKFHFDRTNMQGIKIKGNFSDSTFFDCKMDACYISECTLLNCEVILCSLILARIDKCNVEASLENCEIVHPTMETTSCKFRYSNCKIYNPSFYGAVAGWSFEYCFLSGLEYDNMRDCHFNRCTFGETDSANLKLFGANVESIGFGERRLFGQTSQIFPGSLRGALLRKCDFSGWAIPLEAQHKLLAEAFGTDSCTLPEGLVAGQPPLAHWIAEGPDAEVEARWRAWQKATGYTPAA